MKPHKRHLLFLLVLLAAIPAISTMAGAEGTPTVEAVNEPGGAYAEEQHHWSPALTMVTAGSTVTFKNASSVLHGVEWISPGPKPSCTGGVPVGTTPGASGTNWSGTCSFAQTGVYVFYCTVHGAAMSGRIVVGASGITTISQTTTQSSSGGTTTTTPGPGAPTPETPLGPVLVGSAAKAIKLAASQRGNRVRGSVDVGPGGAGATLEVDLLASSARLAKTKHPAQTRVGRLVRSSLIAGPVSFKVALNAKARRALRVRRRLALTVNMVITPKTGAAVKVTRHVVLHA